MPGRNSGSYAYGQNSQERNSGLNKDIYSAEYWMYDARLGRRWEIDPLTGYYPWQSPYATFNNNPIYFSDLLGLEGGNDQETKTWGVGDVCTDENNNELVYQGNGNWGDAITWRGGITMSGDDAQFGDNPSQQTILNNASSTAHGGTISGPITRKLGLNNNPLKYDNGIPKGAYAIPDIQRKSILSDRLLIQMFRDQAASFDWDGDKNKIVDHFLYGRGEPLSFNPGSSLSDKLESSEIFLEWAKKFESTLIKTYYKSGISGIENIQVGKNLPNFFSFYGILFNSTLAQIMGGVQGVEISLLNVSVDPISRTITLSLKYTLKDTFGAGARDAARGLDGLTSMYILQHYRNTGNFDLYRPFELSISLIRTISFGY